MIKMIIIVAIFFAVYPIIGSGYEQFANDFNINRIESFLANAWDGWLTFIDKLQS